MVPRDVRLGKRAARATRFSAETQQVYEFYVEGIVCVAVAYVEAMR